MKLTDYLNRIIELGFYALFLLVPLIFSGSPSELFELPKMFFTFGITTLIGAAWFGKMILQKQIRIQRTPLDLPLLLFLLANIVSTIYSLDPHVSLWGYYSRFNGGLLSVISYLFLYYALVSNLSVKHIFNLLKITLLAGLAVAAWGLPSHFGYDPTCLIFRGNFDTSCWTDAFKPTIRIFSTLGQPAWLAAYMSILIPIAISFYLINQKSKSESPTKNQESRIKNYGNLTSYFLLLTSILFYACLTFTDTRGGFIGFWVANITFWGLVYFKKLFSFEKFKKYFLIFNLSFLIFNFFAGVPISQLSKFTLPEQTKNSQSQNPTSAHPALAAGELGGTDSGKIRLLVWRGAIDAWRDNPVIGTGVETFAFAYYKYRPIEHNLTSEWDYLYNKAHNEYLNYLATTGALGLGSYLLMIGTFLYLAIIKFKVQNSKLKVENFALCTLHFALVASYVSLLVSNFFGFSVVIINLYFFLIPAFVLILSGALNPKKTLVFPPNLPTFPNSPKITRYQYALLALLLLVMSYLLLVIASYWTADINYAKGSNLDRAGSFQEALTPLQSAVNSKPNEPVYRDELSINLGTLAAALLLDKDASTGAELAQTAVSLSDEVTNSHPNNIVYWKNRVRLFYTLAQGDEKNESKYFKGALDAITEARALAPNDAKVSYNLGILTGQIDGPKKGIEILERTIKLKPDYRDAYFALGLFYNELATDEEGNVVDFAMHKKAIEAYEYILKNIDPGDKQVKETLEKWNANSQ